MIIIPHVASVFPSRIYEFRTNIEPPLENSILISIPVARFLAVIPGTSVRINRDLDHKHNYAGCTMSFVRPLTRYVFGTKT